MQILQIGAIPPPVNGIAVHLRRLCLLCQDTNVGVTAFNPYPSNEKAPSFSFATKFASKNKLVAMTQLLKEVALSKAEIVHLHASRMGNFLKIAPFYLALGKRKKHVITLHGSFTHSFERSRSRTRTKMLSTLRGFSHIIVTNYLQKQLLVENGIMENRISIIPAFLPLSASEINSAVRDPQIADLIASKRRIIVASGSLEPVYGLVPLIKAVKKMKTASDSFALVIASYHRRDPMYGEEVIRLAKELDHVKIFFDLNESDFATLLTHSHIFARPTYEDGDSIALREAIYYQNQIAASDVVPRPQGALLFRMDTPSSIATRLDEALQSPTHGICAAASDNFAAIRAIYHKLSASQSSR